MMESSACYSADHYGRCRRRAPERLVVVGEEVGVTDVWMIGVQGRGPESTWRKVIGVESEGINGTDWSRRGRQYASSSAVSNVEDC
jgi:hypothetical protein